MDLKKEDLVKINSINEFYVRFRKENKKSDKIYYDGFKINKESKISDAFFKFNCTNISKSLKNNNQNELIDKISEYRDKFFDTFRITNVQFEKSEYAKKNSEKYQEKMRNIEKKFNITNIKSKNIIKINFNEVEQEFNLLKILWNIDENGIKDNKTVLFKNISFKYEIKGGDLISAEHVKTVIPELTSFYEKYTKYEEEKKYQHLFLLNIKNNKKEGYMYENIFGKKEIKPFEEEYYIKYPGGRIDCIFYATEDDLITDIDLIELKVDDKVLGGSNGITTHLIDIENIDKETFIDELLDRINYRNYYLNNDIENKYRYSDDFSIHFFVIIGRNRCSNEEIQHLVNDLNNKTSDLYRTVKVKGRKNEPIKNIANRIINKGIDVKLFIDQNKLEYNKINSFKPIYKEYKEAFK